MISVWSRACGMFGRFWRRARRESGFTLIELLVALAVLALVVGLVPQALKLTGRAMDFEARVSNEEQITATLQFLGGRIQAMLPLGERDDTGTSTLVFSGGPDSIRVVSVSRTGPDGGGVYVFDLSPAAGSTTDNTEAVGLKLRQWRWGRPRTEDAPAWSHQLLPRHVRVRFRYFGPAQQRAAPAWSGDWKRTDSVPRLVEITVEDVRSGRVRREVAAPRIDSP